MLPKPFFFTGSSPRTRGTAVLVRSLDGRPRFIPAHAGNRAPPGAVRAARAVHPRARGEQSAAASKGSVTIGSSPRTRGTVTRNPMTGRRPRFIPAHAGNRPVAPTRSTQTPVHPRARGEQPSNSTTRPPRIGSSPRTRGTAMGLLYKLRLSRFIPAHAGNSQHRCGARPGSAVHPRARGEQSPTSAQTAYTCGSSPRTRGTAGPAPTSADQGRFIPAHAGNSGRRAITVATRPVHPRARGEQSLPNPPSRRPAGSSPRTRGTGRAAGDGRRPSRFIPAHAGNSGDGARKAGRGTVHPRARGEQAQYHAFAQDPAGSSPRTRGTALAAQSGDAVLRFIPAHAGNSDLLLFALKPVTVHPRARGEQMDQSSSARGAGGSSPRTRGTVAHDLRGTRLARFIPAHAGNR